MSQTLLLFDSGRRNVFVEAGAGTGKTTEIVRQVLTILLEDPRQSAERLVLITFTEKAAGEIAERIRDALIDLRASFDGPRPGWPADAAERIVAVPEGKRDEWLAACEKHLAQLDLLRSQTIHSFCQSILASFPFEAKLDPSFRIVEGFERGRILDEIWLEWLEDETTADAGTTKSGAAPPAASGRAAVQEGGSAQSGAAASAASGRAEVSERGAIGDWEDALDSLEGIDAVRDVVMQLVPHRAMLEDESAPLASFDEVESKARAAVEEIRSRPASDLATVTDPRQRELLDYLRRESLPAPTRADWIRWLEPVAPILRMIDLPRGKALEWLKGPLKSVLRGEKKEENLYDVLLGDRAAFAVYRLARRFVARLEREKDRRGILDFDDLLVRTERLLRDPAVARAVRSRFDFLFVDEFQDTDRLQARIVERLAVDDSGAMARGKLVLVGDPKQSIYSFRGADPETYGEMLEKFAASGETPKLGRQFRSEPALVAALNAMFARLFSEPSQQNVFRPGYTELAAGRSGAAASAAPWAGAKASADPRPPVRFLRAQSATEGSEIELNTSELQAAATASWIRARIDDGVAAEEFAILLRKMTDVEPYLEALDRAGIESVLPRNTSILDRRAAVDLLAVLRCIAAPFDRGAEVSAARSPLFALTDGEIASDFFLHEAGAQPPEDSPWQRFRSTIRRWRDLARSLPVEQTVATVIRESGIETLHHLVLRGEDSLADLDAVRDLAAQFDREVGGSLALFVEEALRRRDGAAEGEPAVIEEGARGVRIMTVHASKGLEFGTVILPDLNASTSRDALSVFRLEIPSRLFFKGRVTTAAARLLETGGAGPGEVLKARTEAEIDRLFYVAVTRARREVVFVIDPPAVRNESLYKPFLRIFELDPKGIDPLFPTEPGSRADRVRAGAREVEVVFERAVALPERETLPSRFRDPATASRLGELPLADPIAAVTPPLDRGELERAAAAVRQRSAGVLLHRVLEVWDGRSESLGALLETLAAERGVAGRTVEVVRQRLSSLAGSPTLRRIAAAETIGRETTVRFLEAGARVEGRIDRLVRENGRWLVVDYKSGKPSSARLDGDSEQVRRYCRAIGNLTGEPCEGLLWYLDLEGETAVTVSPSGPAGQKLNAER